MKQQPSSPTPLLSRQALIADFEAMAEQHKPLSKLPKRLAHGFSTTYSAFREKTEAFPRG